MVARALPLVLLEYMYGIGLARIALRRMALVWAFGFGSSLGTDDMDNPLDRHALVTLGVVTLGSYQ